MPIARSISSPDSSSGVAVETMTVETVERLAADIPQDVGFGGSFTC